MPSPVIDQLRQRIERLEAPRRRRDALSFGLDPIDRVLPDGGLAFGALHEVAGGGNGAVNGAAASHAPCESSPQGPSPLVHLRVSALGQVPV